jgi:hypothetical protein
MKKIILSMAVATVLFSTAATASDVCLITVNSEHSITKLTCSFDVDRELAKSVQYHPASETMKSLIQNKYELQSVVVLTTGNTMFTFIKP